MPPAELGRDPDLGGHVTVALVPQSNAPGPAGSILLQVFQRLTLDLNEALRVREKHLAGGRQPDLARAPFEQLDAQFTLERLYALGKGRLGDAQQLSSATEVALDRYLKKRLEVP
jgi:hypothetical protein